MSLVRSERRDGTALLTLDRPGANAFSPDLVSDLSEALSTAADAGAVVLASSNPRIFSAGWDLTVIVRFGRVEMTGFVEAYCDLVRQMFVFERPLIAALSGHAIAGGLIVAAAADERVLAEGKAELGLSEVLLGVPVPQCALEIFRHLIGARATERLAATGENVGGARAREIGLVDRLAPAESVTDLAVERARLLAGRPSAAYAENKRRVRAEAVARFDATRGMDPFLDHWFLEESQRRVRALVEKLTKKN